MAKPAPLDGIVNNGFDFFRKSLAEFDAEPKFSVIHFFAAVELFLKARLMAEHWSLVVSKDPSWEGFERGDFKSVTLPPRQNSWHCFFLSVMEAGGAGR
jgi:hypothetical protein